MSTAKIDRRVEHSHHFSSMEQEHEAGKQGTWLFMATEIMMFGGLFVGYFVYRFFNEDLYIAGGDSLNWMLGAFNTLVLLISSFTMAQAVTETMNGNNKKAFKLVVITTLCAAIFMVVKYFEYTGKFANGISPVNNVQTYEDAEKEHKAVLKYKKYQEALKEAKGDESRVTVEKAEKASYAGYNQVAAWEYARSHVRENRPAEVKEALDKMDPKEQRDNLRIFYLIYFAMTGLHGIHILIGIGLMFWLMKRLKNDEFSPKYYTAVEGVGLYWHIVDIIWIFLFPLMYLI